MKEQFLFARAREKGESPSGLAANAFPLGSKCFHELAVLVYIFSCIIIAVGCVLFLRRAIVADGATSSATCSRLWHAL
ncbi:MAG: hypothetical protein RR405_02925 [Clostridia bacterium]